MKALLQSITHSIHEGKLKCSNFAWLIGGSVHSLEFFLVLWCLPSNIHSFFPPKSFPTCYLQSIYLVVGAVEIAYLNFSTTPQRCNTNWRLLCTNSDRLFLVSWVTMEWFEHAKQKLVARTSGVLRQYCIWWSGELCQHFLQRKTKRQRHWALKDGRRELLLTRTKLNYDYVSFQEGFFCSQPLGY